MSPLKTKITDLSISAKLMLVITMAALVTALSIGGIVYVKFAAELESSAKIKLAALRDGRRGALESTSVRSSRTYKSSPRATLPVRPF